MTEPEPEPEPQEAPSPESLRCDFCGQASPRVRRIALDAGYDRLQRPHHEQYACPDCSRRKEAERAS